MQFYRFRNADKMLEFEELQKKNMFFAPPEKQNDPMEGLSDIVWDGDQIAWKNFFKNYVMNLANAFSLYYSLLICNAESVEIDGFKDVKRVFQKSYNIYPQLIRIATAFVDDEIVKAVICYIENREVRKLELSILLFSVHPLALKYIFDSNLVDSTVLPVCIDKTMARNNYSQFIEILRNETVNPVDNFKREKQYEYILSFYNTMLFGARQCILDIAHQNCWQKEGLLFLHNEYFNYYIGAISKWCTPNWFSVCFTNCYENPSMWGYYADGHKGVCLIYEVDEINGIPSLAVKRPKSFGVPNGRWERLDLIPVEYKSNLIPWSFFENALGIAQLRDDLIHEWTRDKDGNKSVSFSGIDNDKNRWAKVYTENYKKVISRKDKDWSHENEYRLILPDFWNDEIQPNGQALEYDFSKLVGIIFGINISERNKFAIIEALRTSGKFTEKFEFYQAYYDLQTGKIAKQKIPIWEAYNIPH